MVRWLLQPNLTLPGQPKATLENNLSPRSSFGGFFFLCPQIRSRSECNVFRYYHTSASYQSKVPIYLHLCRKKKTTSNNSKRTSPGLMASWGAAWHQRLGCRMAKGLSGTPSRSPPAPGCHRPDCSSGHPQRCWVGAAGAAGVTRLHNSPLQATIAHSSRSSLGLQKIKPLYKLSQHLDFCSFQKPNPTSATSQLPVFPSRFSRQQ